MKIVKIIKQKLKLFHRIWKRNSIFCMYFITTSVIIIWLCVCLLTKQRFTKDDQFIFDKIANEEWSVSGLKGDNQTGYPIEIVPNIIHYIILKQHYISFAHYISLKSVIRNHKPDLIMIHCDCDKLDGEYWTRIKLEEKHVNITIRTTELPDEIFGEKFSSEWKLWHASDVLRNRVLLEFGGIYLDRDVYVVKSLNKFRRYEMVAGLEYNNFGNQIQIANKNARFLKLYLLTYKLYKSNEWYYNAGILPMKMIVNNYPHLIHLVKEKFGLNYNTVFQLLYIDNSKTWQNDYYAFHLLMRNNSLKNNARFVKNYNKITIEEITEDHVKTLSTSFGQMTRLLLF